MVSIKLPSLRERGSDIALLIAHYLHQAGLTYQRNIRLRPEALEMLCKYDWPGNIRQLQNLMTRLVLMSAHEEIDCEAIGLHLSEEVTLQPADPFNTTSPQTRKPAPDTELTRAYFEVHSHDNDTLLNALKQAKGTDQTSVHLPTGKTGACVTR